MPAGDFSGTWLGGVELANPDYAHEGIIYSRVDVGAFHQLLDGSIAYDHTSTRRRWSLRWNHITSAEAADINTQYQIKTTQEFSPPDQDNWAYYALVVPNSGRFSYTEAGNGDKLYNWEMELEQVS